MQIFKQFLFDSAHFLPNVPEGHKCKEIHGHTYRMVLHIEGPLVKHLEWVMDFAELKKVVEPVVNKVDHQLMNNIPGLENPTCENIAIWLWNKIKPEIPSLIKIELHETPSSGVIYEGK
ncbi:MAG: 6-carboxytetrahydropterin synthase QueD [Bacteroidetes bacterium]|nr:6-carboxytetrahydropterin synthase QueD [Bacteroidota bacterium]MBP7399795.1 6-carboxytetrahydropterin synthase QueD [Chitinophagales bacterium]MBK7109999.1 6-carboxytetrahydropterin synthase QueD [Bacteroidota bacterium]MBK8487277.1 6-carboxytetrahydropterin synthase QueD [Bacteroidota bacterium]MBK8682985.1 6-carboxytetrahydropterin synthase QueD [Bacteroidota bacterium]